MNLKDESVYYLKRLLKRNTLQSIRENASNSQFDKHKCIFIHIPKTAGISVASSLFQTRMGHLTALNFKAMLGKADFNNYFKFAFVRNPFTRLVSAYEFMQSGGYGPVDEDIVAIVKRYPTLEEFVLNFLTPATAKSIRHFRPQHYFICDSDYKLMIDYVGSFEELEKDYEYIRQKISIGEPLKKLNTTKVKKHAPKDYYSNDRVVQKVITIYGKDFELFKYSKQPLSAT